MDSGTRGRLADPTRREGEGATPPVKTGVRAPKNPPLRSIRPRARARARAAPRDRKKTGGGAVRARLEERRGRRRGLLSSSSPPLARATPLRACAERRDANRFQTPSFLIWKTNVRRRALTLCALLPSTRFSLFCLRAAAARHHAARGKTLSHQSASQSSSSQFISDDAQGRRTRSARESRCLSQPGERPAIARTP